MSAARHQQNALLSNNKEMIHKCVNNTKIVQNAESVYVLKKIKN